VNLCHSVVGECGSVDVFLKFRLGICWVLKYDVVDQFLLRDAVQAWPMPSCGVCVCLCVCHIRTFCRNE